MNLQLHAWQHENIPAFWKQWDNISKQDLTPGPPTFPKWGSRATLNTEASWEISCCVPRKKKASALFPEMFFTFLIQISSYSWHLLGFIGISLKLLIKQYFRNLSVLFVLSTRNLIPFSSQGWLLGEQKPVTPTVWKERLLKITFLPIRNCFCWPLWTELENLNF